jgi:uncharacterized repeat protein (TIGR03803 family)
MNGLRFALCTGAVFAVLAGCGGGGVLRQTQDDIPQAKGDIPQAQDAVTPLGKTTAQRSALRPAYSVLFSFGTVTGAGDGASPEAGLLNVSDKLYGTTAYLGYSGFGTVFTITTSGKETELYNFAGPPTDGAYPEANLINVKGTLFGTTLSGGTNGDGTVFSITPSGTETVLHSFGASGDGIGPSGALINLNGTLYGTTLNGGASGDGTVFSIATSGAETVLHSFGGSGDGFNPSAGLLNVKGTLYGTTEDGGAYDGGVVFAITTSGAESVLHSFGNETDGLEPVGDLINVKGTLYGTTNGGGTKSVGTVYKLTRSGKETVLYSFRDKPDGAYPEAGLLNIKGKLYGATRAGGGSNCEDWCGIVFSLTFSGSETVLYTFQGPKFGDGAHPYASLIDVKGALYGTTYAGGQGTNCNADGGCGTVFSLSP